MRQVIIFLMSGPSAVDCIPDLGSAGAPCFRVVALGPEPGLVPFSGFDPQSLKVAIAIAVAFLEEREQGVSKSRVHADGFSRLVGANALSSERLLEQSLFIAATAVEDTGWRHARWILATFSAGVMPSTESVSSSIEGTECLNPCFCPGFPRGLELSVDIASHLLLDLLARLELGQLGLVLSSEELHLPKLVLEDGDLVLVLFDGTRAADKGGVHVGVVVNVCVIEIGRGAVSGVVTWLGDVTRRRGDGGQ